MPPDVFLMMASSGIALVASLMFLVTDDRPPPEVEDDPRAWVTFFGPPAVRPLAVLAKPPALPLSVGRNVIVPLAGQVRLHFELDGANEWRMKVEAGPLADSPALGIVEDEHGVMHGRGQVNDLRWHGRAGLASRAAPSWKKTRPGQA